ncbi:porin family protein [Chitinophaga skermanii]|nr:porin family protein [Chitinophaga skermanii]
MKKLICCCLLCLLTYTAQSQALIALVFGGKITNTRLRVGIYLGASGSWITEGDGQVPRYGLAIGAYTNYRLQEKWDLVLNIVMKQPKGANEMNYDNKLIAPLDSNLIGTDIDRRVTYLDVMPMIRYNITPSWGIAFGPQLAARTTAKDTYKKDDENGTLSYQVKTKDYIKRIDVGLSFDVQYTLMKGHGMRLNATYNLGLMNFYKDNAGLTGKHQQILVGVGIPIGKTK